MRDLVACHKAHWVHAIDKQLPLASRIANLLEGTVGTDHEFSSGYVHEVVLNANERTF